MSRRRTFLVALATLALALEGCASSGATSRGPATAESSASGAGAGPTTELSVPTQSASRAAEVKVIPDLAFESSSLNALGGLDIYAPAAAGPWPVVVMFHGQPLTKSFLASYATSVAALGFVVFVPTWGQSGGHDYDAMSIKDQLLADGRQSACALAFAAERAPEYGGDAESLTVFGHSAGGNIASVVVLGQPAVGGGCLAQATPEVDVLESWDADFLIVTEAAGWDAYLAGDPTLMESITPWAHLPPPPNMRFVMLQPENSGVGRTATDALGADGWLAARDPDGTKTAVLDEIGAFDDGFIAPDETDQVFAEALRAHGADVTLLTMPGSSHTGLSPEGLSVLLDAFREIGGY